MRLTDSPKHNAFIDTVGWQRHNNNMQTVQYS